MGLLMRVCIAGKIVVVAALPLTLTLTLMLMLTPI